MELVEVNAEFVIKDNPKEIAMPIINLWENTYSNALSKMS